MVEKLISNTDDVIYSTHPEFEKEYACVDEPETLAPENQTLLIQLHKRKIDGALVTIITGFVGKRIDLLKICEELQSVCRTCGSARMYDISLLRDVRGRAYVHLRNHGYKVQLERTS